jgi:hypothetical protein
VKRWFAGGLAALALVCAAGAGAAAPKGFYGVAVSGPALDGTVSLSAQLQRIQRAGGDQITVAFNWADVDPSGPPEQAAEHWESLDRLVTLAARRHLRIVPVLVQAPPWARTDPARPFSPPKDPAAFGAFAGRAAARYGARGTFWSAHPSLPRVVVRDWQVWNEPSGGNGVDDPSVFWQKEGPWVDDYVALLKAAHTAVRAADPSARVLLGGLVGRSWQALPLLYDAGAGPYFERIALHPYTGDPHNVDVILQRCRAVMRKHGDAKVPFVLTEFGWPSFNSDEYKRLGAAKIARYQAQWAQTAIAELTNERRKLRIASVFWFTWLSHDTSDSDAFDYAGLTRLTPGGKVVAKPSLKVFSRWAMKARRARS